MDAYASWGGIRGGTVRLQPARESIARRARRQLANRRVPSFSLSPRFNKPTGFSLSDSGETLTASTFWIDQANGRSRAPHRSQVPLSSDRRRRHHQPRLVAETAATGPARTSTRRSPIGWAATSTTPRLSTASTWSAEERPAAPTTEQAGGRPTSATTVRCSFAWPGTAQAPIASATAVVVAAVDSSGLRR